MIFGISRDYAIALYSFKPSQRIHLEDKATFILANPDHTKTGIQFPEMFLDTITNSAYRRMATRMINKDAFNISKMNSIIL